MEDPRNILASARDAYRRRDWPNARDRFEAARPHIELEADDLYQLGDAEWWLGEIDAAIRHSEDAHHAFLRDARPRQAAMAAMGIAISLYLRGDDALGSGWMSRAMRVLGDEPTETAEHGYLAYIEDVESQFGGADPEGVAAAARRVREIGLRHGDPNLVAAGILGEGRMLIRMGRMREGMPLLDEAMVAVLSDELSPEWAGNIYCNLIAACRQLGDIRRAAQWTDATERWLDTMPVAVLFRGICRVHRSQVLQIRGDWDEAEQIAVRVCEDLAGISIANVAEGHYQIGEIRRLRGDVAGAETAYREAHRHGRDPQPGLALLRLAQGRVATAAASIEAALAGTPTDRLLRAPLLAAMVEIASAAGERRTARRGADELAAIALVFGSSGMEAVASEALGTAALMEDDAASALALLRDALRRWQALGAPYDVARVRHLLARAYVALEDHDAAQLEREAEATALDALGARRIAHSGIPADRDGLSGREIEVLASVAAGRTNRQVAEELFISEKTVARHLSNIFAKLDLSSRTEAAAYAFEHGIGRRLRG